MQGHIVSLDPSCNPCWQGKGVSVCQPVCLSVPPGFLCRSTHSLPTSPPLPPPCHPCTRPHPPFPAMLLHVILPMPLTRKQRSCSSCRHCHTTMPLPNRDCWSFIPCPFVGAIVVLLPPPPPPFSFPPVSARAVWMLVSWAGGLLAWLCSGSKRGRTMLGLG